MNTESKHLPLNALNNILKTISDYPRGTGFLAFRDLNRILNQYVDGINALDFGCGAGRSSRILQEHGLNVIGVDTSSQMIRQAREISKDIKYILIEKNEFQNIRNQFDLILISFVLMEISSTQEITSLIKKLRNLLSDKGKMILIVASNDFYTSNWLSVKTESKHKLNKGSGDVVSVYLKDYGITINDYLWTENDCERCFQQSNMVLLKKLKPLGVASDGKKWVDEYKKSPFVIYVISK